MRSAAKRGRSGRAQPAGRPVATPGTQHTQHEEGDWDAGDEQQGDAAEVEDVEMQANVIMAAAAHSGCTGIAAFDALAGSITCFKDTRNRDKLLGAQSVAQTLHLAVLQLQPDVIVISSKAEPQLAEAARAQTGDGPAVPACHVLTERAALFQYSQALKKLASLSVQGMPPYRTQQEHLNYLNTLVDLSCEPMVAALGALLAVLQRRQSKRASLDPTLPDVPGAAESGLLVQSLTELPLQGCMMLDEASLQSLQIFADELHPSNMGIGKTKEGFSIYGMMQAQCTTQMGKRLLRSWMLRPVADLATIQDRQDTVQLLVDARDVAAALQGILKKVQDIPRLLQRLSSCQLKPDLTCFKQMHASLTHLLTLRDIVQQMADGSAGEACRGWSSVRLGQRLLDSIPDDLHTCCQLITDVINFEQDDDMMVRYGVCQDLDDLKDTYLGLPDLLTKVLEGELSRVPSFLAKENNTQLWSILYLPQVGYVVQVSGQPLSEDLLDELSDFSMFMEGVADDGSPSVYYHTAATKELSSRIGDILYKIQDLESTLCTELVKRLLQFEAHLRAASLAVAELDCLMGFATVASNNAYCRPQLAPEPVLDIQGGRHPLAEVLVDTYIPNDTCMPADHGRVHVITGPNASGKSCYIKSVALIAYLAHLGSFVPATKAVVGLVDRIFTRLVSHENARLQQSTFMVDLSQVAGMLNKATCHSLIICDEFGKGTLTYDGVGLLAASLQQFCSMAQPPRALACTHFHELFSPDIMRRSPQLQFYTMDVLSTPQQPGSGQLAGAGAATGARPESAADGAGTSGTALPGLAEPSVFLYRLVAGHQTPSFGFYCAQMCGVPEEVLSRAREVVRCLQDGTPLPRSRAFVAGHKHQEYQALVQVLLAMDLQAPTWQQAAARLLAAAAASGQG